MTGSNLHAGPRFARGPAFFLAILLLFLCRIPCAMADFRITELQAELPDCTPDLSSLTICMIADLHLSAGNRTRHIFTALTGHLNRLKPDILLLGGDIFHGAPGRDPKLLEEIWKEFLDRLTERPKRGIFAVLGNHDKRKDAQEIRSLLQRSGVRLLAESTAALRVGKSTLYLAGTEHEPGEPFAPEFLKKLSSSRPLLLLAHYPEIFDLVPDDAKILVLAGHTHGGVMNIPGLKKGELASCLSPAHRTKYVFGSYGSTGGKRLYVTAGIGGEGSSGLRFNNPPEIVVIRLAVRTAARPPETGPASPAGN